jgi:hypothetical protein
VILNDERNHWLEIERMDFAASERRAKPVNKPDRKNNRTKTQYRSKGTQSSKGQEQVDKKPKAKDVGQLFVEAEKLEKPE